MDNYIYKYLKYRLCKDVAKLIDNILKDDQFQKIKKDIIKTQDLMKLSPRNWERNYYMKTPQYHFYDEDWYREVPRMRFINKNSTTSSHSPNTCYTWFDQTIQDFTTQSLECKNHLRKYNCKCNLNKHQLPYHLTLK